MFSYLKPNYVTIARRRHFSFAGQIYPSVSKILTATKPERDRQALQRWRKRVGYQQAQKISTAACQRGTSLHTAIKYYLEGKPLPEDVEDNVFWHSITPVLTEVSKVHLVESAVYHQECRYAGVVDCLGEWESDLCVFDWKTASKPKKIEWITDYCLQVTAYTAAIASLYNVNVDRAIIAIALSDREAQTFHLNSEELNDYWQQFNERLRLYQSLP
ncbi:PD-(D/E)XK nuclease family protein [Myxosarcina sp. GI1]|uniref:PD-(D/E)XK nuclease family protein n=1 Tax=Myxosarcina sp. GI1 TaxID=1541065 RepID=UPI000566E779|nr:PD-(D/E)XK nuclease family protein [Myxosarcina sp. GI1]